MNTVDDLERRIAELEHEIAGYRYALKMVGAMSSAALQSSVDGCKDEAASGARNSSVR